MSYNIAPLTDQTGRAGLSFVQTTQAGSQTISQVNIPVIGSRAPNPRNLSYAWNANGSVGVINAILGRRTPAFTNSAWAKSTWFTPGFINDILGGTDSFLSSSYVTSEYAARIWQPVAYPRLSGVTGAGLYRDYLGLHCMGLEMVHTATSGVLVTMNWLAICAYTDDLYYYSISGLSAENPAVLIGSTPPSIWSALPTVSAYTKDAGLQYGPADVVYGIATVSGNVVTGFTPYSTAADEVDGFTLSFQRGTAQQMYENGTIWPAGVTTASVGGTLRVLQAGTYRNPPTNFAVRIGPAGGSGVIITPVTSLDSLDQPLGQGRSVITGDMSLVDLTGSVFSNGYPFYICASF
jgi:hypothetical protein